MFTKRTGSVVPLSSSNGGQGTDEIPNGIKLASMIAFT